jgi:ketosteroid isomerase-like protein
MAGDGDAIARTYADYFEAFQRLEPEAVLPYCHTPFMVLAPSGVMAVTGQAEARDLFGEMMKGLRERGYARSAWRSLGVHQLSESTAMVSAGVVRYRADDSVLERFGATYTLRRTDAGWMIVVLAIHDADTVLDLPGRKASPPGDDLL